MQISNQEVTRVRDAVRKPRGLEAEAPIHTVEELAARHTVSMDEVRQFTEQVRMADEDPLRERRLREIAQRIAKGTYGVDSDQLVDMAERRAIADRSAEL